MVMTPWDNPVSLTRAWCLVELFACRSSGSRFNVALPPCERARFLQEICDKAEAFYGMLRVNTAKSECSRTLIGSAYSLLCEGWTAGSLSWTAACCAP